MNDHHALHGDTMDSRVLECTLHLLTPTPRSQHVHFMTISNTQGPFPEFKKVNRRLIVLIETFIHMQLSPLINMIIEFDK